ncbi:AraC family transcriptional regulator [Kineosporia sp. NBRC 101731]|uniref:helix-turn-helix transcriptional regulator n=1 Tax=Kineosporia sp. NBRC 101731 TaxID=3032199 RepID=UPI0024A450EA|nr:AraC family transcriptional regulator [Kineosporia sp. NBRC 101731]GLY30368.1 AraC family transcriptional regulator [Kineosporia sp. NBRC 101731]
MTRVMWDRPRSEHLLPDDARPSGGHVISCDEFGYAPGERGGILVARYRSSGPLEFGEGRQNVLHQLYFSPGGLVGARPGAGSQFVGPAEVFWVRRGVLHEVTAGRQQIVYRVGLREEPSALKHRRVGAAGIEPEAVALLRALGSSGVPAARAVKARARVLAGIGATFRELAGTPVNGSGYAMRVAQALTHDPGDPTSLEEWARRLHVSVKTLQRDFVKEFGLSYTQWRTRLRLLASRVLLETSPVTEVARRVGYASTSAFIVAFTREFGVTPGRQRTS